MTGTKYIVVANDNHYEQMILFPSNLRHDQMARAMKRLRYPHIVSAGFVDDYMQCYGESTSVRRCSRGDTDTIMLKAMLSIDDKDIRDSDWRNLT